MQRYGDRNTFNLHLCLLLHSYDILNIKYNETTYRITDPIIYANTSQPLNSVFFIFIFSLQLFVFFIIEYEKA